MKCLKANQGVLSLAIFSIIASLFISLFFLGFAHGEEEAVSKAKKGCPSGAPIRISCGQTTKGVVCNDWQTIFEDNFEGDFPGPVSGYDGEWENLGDGLYWGLTTCTSPDGTHSIWCGYPNSPCPNHPYNSSEEKCSSVLYSPLYDPESPPDCDIIRVSFDYNYKEDNQNRLIVPWCVIPPPLGEWARYEVVYYASDVFEMFEWEDPWISFYFAANEPPVDWWGAYVDNVKVQAGR